MGVDVVLVFPNTQARGIINVVVKRSAYIDNEIRIISHLHDRVICLQAA